jgi:hypothetical protein
MSDILPPFFPLKTKKCADVAQVFFACYEKESFPNGVSLTNDIILGS